MSRAKSDQTFIAKPFLKAGAAFCAIEYDLIPNVKMSDIVTQCRRAITWIFFNAKKFNIDTNKIFLSGHSAGGHLVSILMSTDWSLILDRNYRPFKGGCAVSGLFELEPVQLCYVQDILNLSDSDVLEFSPIRFEQVPKEPLIIAVGSDESSEFIRQSFDFSNSWSERGALCSYFKVAGCNHFNILNTLADPSSNLTNKIIDQMGI